MMPYQTTVDEQTIAQAEFSQYLDNQAKALADTFDLDCSFQSLQHASFTILKHALELANCKQRLSRKEYKLLLQEKGWQTEEKIYLKLAATFDKFLPENLAEIEPDTLFRLAKNSKKYQSVIDQLLDLPQVTQEAVRELINQQRQPKQPKSEKPSIWRRTPNGGRYCQIPPIHEEDERTGVTLQKMMDEEGLLPQQSVAEAISLRQALKEGRLIMVTDSQSVQSDSDSDNSGYANSGDTNTEASPDISELNPPTENYPQPPNPTAIRMQPEAEKEGIALACALENQQTAIDEQEVVSIDTVISLLQQANSWSEVVRITENCSSEVKIKTWSMLNYEDKQRIDQLKQQQEEKLKNMPQVGDKVMWINCHAHLSSWQPFVIRAIEGNNARLDFYAHPVPLDELEVCRNNN